jgi:SAM-dependent methyltransferase
MQIDELLIPARKLKGGSCMKTVARKVGLRGIRPATEISARPHTAVSLESPSHLMRAGFQLVSPLKNFLLPAGWLQRRLRRSGSPLIAESFVRPGGWRSMEIAYRNDDPVDWFDRQALRHTPACMASRNRLKMITARLASLIARFARAGDVAVLGVGAGPGRHVQTAIVDSGVAPERVMAWLIDRDDDAFTYGRALAARLEISRSVRFLKGDARRIRESLPDVSAQIVKVVGLAEYLSDAQLMELFIALRQVLAPQGTLITHGFVDAHRNGPFLARVFNLRHIERDEKKMTAILKAAGFQVDECVVEPVGVYPIITARRAS